MEGNVFMMVMILRMVKIIDGHNVSDGVGDVDSDCNGCVGDDSNDGGDDDGGGGFGGDVDDDGDGDIYIMMKCLSFCLSRKIMTSYPPRAQRETPARPCRP